MVSWYGIGEDWSQDVEPATDIDLVLSKWITLLDRAEKWKFNTVRLAFRFPESPSTPDTVVSTINYETLDSLLGLLDSRHLKAIIDLHNYRDMYGWLGSSEWINCWVGLAQKYKLDNRIIAYELFNEPFESCWDSSVVDYTGVLRVLAECVDAIRATGDNHTIVYPAPGYFGSLTVPLEYRRPNIVITHHPWSYGNPSTIEEAVNLADYRISKFLPYRDQGFELWVGEFGQHGASVGGGTTYEIEKAYVVRIINLALQHNLGFNWWLYSRNHWIEGSADDILQTSNYSVPVSLPFHDDFADLTKWTQLKGTWGVI